MMETNKIYLGDAYQLIKDIDDHMGELKVLKILLILILCIVLSGCGDKVNKDILELEGISKNDNLHISKLERELKESEIKSVLKEVAKDVCMHVAAIDPRFLDRTSVDPETIEHERKVLTAEALNEGKPEAIVAKMVEGRIQKLVSLTASQASVYFNKKLQGC